MADGYKSFSGTQQWIPIAPLTILAGANSSGKSSAIQPLLLLKQTLEAQFDPGPLLLDGAHVRFSRARDLMFRQPGQSSVGKLKIGVELNGGTRLISTYSTGPRDSLKLDGSTFIQPNGSSIELSERQTPQELARALPEFFEAVRASFEKTQENTQVRWRVRRSKPFLTLDLVAKRPSKAGTETALPVDFGPSSEFSAAIQQIIHVPGLRGNPERTYQTSAIASVFPGPFHSYVASVLRDWENNRDPRLRYIGNALASMGLTWKVATSSVNASAVELHVGRLPRAKRGAAYDLVSIADVGFGVSQVLPVIIALLVAGPGRLVFVEQPEIHLHPRAVVALASLFASAAESGVQVVVETHSAILLLALQSLVAQGKLKPEKTALHWFHRDHSGCTAVTSATLDRAGAYGDWPEDFISTTLKLQDDYLGAAGRILGLDETPIV